MPRRYDSAAAKRRILSVCVRLFIEKGYRGTRMADIIHAADVSSSTFQNIFHSKDGVLMELVQFMFENQFALANSLTMGNTSPALLYAVETSIQLALAEINENLREIYVEAYTLPEPSAYIHRQTAVELQRLFSAYLPDCDSRDFYEMEIGTAGHHARLHANALRFAFYTGTQAGALSAHDAGRLCRARGRAAGRAGPYQPAGYLLPGHARYARAV